jgi:glutathione peroxidase-family protein
VRRAVDGGLRVLDSRRMRDFQLTRLQGGAFDTAELQGKAVLFVNVASKCGLTPQYALLQSLFDSRAERGLVVVGVPCNQFGEQEPGTADEIAEFCSLNYGVSFPLLAKQDVNGADRSPLFTWLIGDGKDIVWNFAKFLVDRDGNVVGRFTPDISPDAPEFLASVDAALG